MTHEANSQTEEMRVERNEDDSFNSVHQPNPGDDDLLNAQNVTIERPSDDDEFDLDIEWDKQHDWLTNSLDFELEDHSVYQKKMEDLKNLSNTTEDPEVLYNDLNQEQKQAHDMIFKACQDLQEGIESSTDGGEGIGRLQLLLGKGGTGKSFNLNAVITSLKSRLNFSRENYSKHGTTGIAATNINGTTIQNWRTGLGFFRDSVQPLSGTTLAEMQEKWKDCKLIIIDEFSMLRQ